MNRHTLTIAPRARNNPLRPTPRMHAAAMIFGIDPAPNAAPPPFAPFSLPFGPGDILLITGPSGAGKSCAIQALAAALQSAAFPETTPPGTPPRLFFPEAVPIPSDRALVDCFPCPLDKTLHLLSMAGLAEARLLVMPPASLSTGQQWRYRLAQFFASDAQVLVADEFAASLDPLTARILAWQVGKFVRTHRAANRSAIIASHLPELQLDLRPTLHLEIGLDAAVHILHTTSPEQPRHA